MAIERLRIQNNRVKPLTFTIEPWGDVHPMPPQAVFEIVATGPPGGILELDAQEEGWTVYGWAGSVVSIFYQGNELGAGSSGRQPVPSVPPGQTVKGVVAWMNKNVGPQPLPGD